MTTIDATLKQALDALTSYKPQSLTHAKEQEAAVMALRAALTEAQMVQPALTDIDALAKLYCGSYASPHHITFTVEGLRNMIQAAIVAAIASKGAQPVQPPSKALSDAEILAIAEKHLIDGLYKRSGVGAIPFARAIEQAHGIGAQE